MKSLTPVEILRSLFLMLLLVAGPAGPADAGESVRAYGGGPFLFRVAVPSAGLLLVDVASPGSRLEPSLGFVGRCGTPKADLEPLVVDRSATHLMMAVASPGTYLFRVASPDRALPLGDVKVGSGFTPGAGTTGALAKNGEDEEIIEIEVDPLTLPCGGALAKNGEDEEIIEIEVDPLVAPGAAGGRPLHALLAELCRAGGADDHGDSFPCATFLPPNRRVAGEIANGWGDDADVFQIVLGAPAESGLWSVEISAAGELELAGVLYDGSGRRLEASAASGDAGFRFARVLPAGSYFARVEGRHGAEGHYELAVAASRW